MLMQEIIPDAYSIAFIRSSIIFSSGVSWELCIFIFDLLCLLHNLFTGAFGIQNYLIKHKIAR